MSKEKVKDAELIPGPSIALLVIQQLLKGLEIKANINGKEMVGYIHSLDFAKGADHVFASVSFPGEFLENDLEDVYVRMAIKVDGSVMILPDSR